MMVSTEERTRNYVEIGEAKSKQSGLKLFILGILAGIFVAGAGAGSAAAAVSVHQESLAKLINACIFPAGLAMVVVAGSELFTGNCLMIIPALEKRITVLQMLRSWFFVYLGNFVGSIAFVWMCTYGHVYTMFDYGLADTLMNIAVSKVSLSFADAVIKGILCNILVCIAVWMTFATRTAHEKIVCLFLPIMVFVICGLEHSIANMSYISGGLFMKDAYGMEAPELTWISFLIKNLLPVTIGNIIGGCFVGTSYWIVYLRKDKCEKSISENINI